MNYAQYLKKIVDNPDTPREQYMWAWRELQNMEFKQAEINEAAKRWERGSDE